MGCLELLFTKDAQRQIRDELANTKTHLHIVTAYCKMDAIRFIEESLKSNVPTKKLLVRFKFGDIVNGSSDLEIYEYCKKHSWEMYIRFDLHAKTYIFDNLRCMLGSANLTSRGIGLIEDHNFEISTVANLSSGQMKKIEDMFEDSILMTDELFSLMKNDVKNRVINEDPSHASWNKDILQYFKPKIETLFTYEFPNCYFSDVKDETSLDFLELQSIETSAIIRKFKQCNVYRWLVEKLKQMPEQTISFGALSAELHDAIINDPKPYRKEVKQLQVYLLDWITVLGIEEIKIERPYHRQMISLISTNAN